jgi:hypothetical protein
LVSNSLDKKKKQLDVKHVEPMLRFLAELSAQIWQLKIENEEKTMQIDLNRTLDCISHDHQCVG